MGATKIGIKRQAQCPKTIAVKKDINKASQNERQKGQVSSL